MSPGHNGDDSDGIVSRRRYVQAVGAAGLGAIAGCSSDGGSDTTTESNGGGGTDETTESGGEPIDPKFTFSGGAPRVQFNPFNPTQYHDGRLMFDRLAQRRTPKSEYFPLIAQDWSLDGTTAKIKLSEDYKWSDGEDLTAEDVLTRFQIGKYFGHSAWNYMTSMKATGEYELTIETDGEVNTKLLWNSILMTKVNAPPQIFGEYLTKLQEAEGDDQALKQAKSELLNFRLDEPIDNGPFIWKEKAQETFVHEKNPDYPQIDKINFDTVEYTGGGSKQKQVAGLQSGTLDAVQDTFLQTSMIKNLPDHVLMCYLPAQHGSAIYFNHNDKIFGDWRVRKAIAYAVDWKSVANSANFGGADAGIKQQEFQPHNTGVLKSRTDAYFDDVQANYESYMTKVDKEKAATLLKDAGFSRDGGKWYQPDGDRFLVPVKNPIEPSRNAATRDMLAQLDAFGMKTELRTVDGSTYWGKTAPQGNYRISAGPSWGSIGYHPYYSYQLDFGKTGRVSATKYPATEVKVPGYNDVGGDYTETVNPRQQMQSLAKSPADSEKETNLVRQLAWVWNQTLPCIGFTVTNDTHITTNDEWNLPEPDHPVLEEVKYPHEVLFRPHIEDTKEGSDVEWPHITAKTK